MRAGSFPRGKFTGPTIYNSKPGGRVQSKTPERKDDNLYQIMKNLDKKMKEMRNEKKKLEIWLKLNWLMDMF